MRVGVPPANIFVSSEGPRPGRRIPRMNFGLANRQNVLRQHALLRGRMDGASTLIIYITGHGGKSRRGRPTNTFVALHRSYALFAEEFLSMVRRDLAFARLILVIDACYSGGFVKTFEGTKRGYTGASPTDEHHPTFCQPFSPLFWRHLPATDDAGIRTGFEEALRGCSTFRQRRRCRHAPYGCPSYRQRQTFRRKGG